MPKDTVVQVGSDNWKSWQIALAVGVPAAVVGIYIYRRYSKKSLAIVGTPLTEKKVQKDVSAQAYKKRGNKHFMAGQYEEAIECYSKAIEFGSEVEQDELSTFHQNRAAAQEHMKNYLQVIADCSRALELNPKYVKALNRRAKAYRSTGFLTECLDDVTAACIIENFTNHTNIILADEVIKELSQKKATEKLKSRPPFDPSPSYVWTVLNSFSKDPVFKYSKTTFDENYLIAEESEKNSPFLKALREFYADNFKNTVNLCTEELNGEDSKYKLEALLMRGTLHFLKGQFDSALNDFHDVLNAVNTNEDYKVNILIKEAKVKLQKSEVQESLDLFKKAEEIDPSNPDIYMHRGQLHLIMDNLELAISEFQKSISLDDSRPTPHVHKCLAEIKQLRDSSSPQAADLAIKSFDALVAKFPNCSDVYAFYGQTLMDSRMFDEANKCFDKAISLDPKNPTPYVHKGILKISQNEDYNGAVTQLTKAVKVDGKSSFALQALGSIELQRGALDQAIKYINQAIDVSPNEIEIAHLYSLLMSAEVQVRVAQQQGVQLPPLF